MLTEENFDMRHDVSVSSHLKSPLAIYTPSESLNQHGECLEKTAGESAICAPQTDNLTLEYESLAFLHASRP